MMMMMRLMITLLHIASQLESADLVRSDSCAVGFFYRLPALAAFQDNPCHDSMAENVCNEILSNPHSFHLRLWTRTLNQLSLSPDNHTHLKDLSLLCQRMLEVLSRLVFFRSPWHGIAPCGMIKVLLK